jgi:menaquinone-dependent protoporphyrinogen oxidase
MAVLVAAASIDSYDAVEPARTFAADHAAELAARPTWLFSSGPIGDPPRPKADEAVHV